MVKFYPNKCKYQDSEILLLKKTCDLKILELEDDQKTTIKRDGGSSPPSNVDRQSQRETLLQHKRSLKIYPSTNIAAKEVPVSLEYFDRNVRAMKNWARAKMMLKIHKTTGA